jgi:hypothetical protein
MSIYKIEKKLYDKSKLVRRLEMMGGNKHITAIKRKRGTYGLSKMRPGTLSYRGGAG